MNVSLNERIQSLSKPSFRSSYNKEDVIMVFKEIIAPLETETSEKERLIQSGVHYSEMLPSETTPSVPVETFRSLLADKVLVNRLAYEIGILAERIYQKHEEKPFTLVSLARAGTPIGILIKRYLARMVGIDIPHYSISILRDKGLDFNALSYIIQQQGAENIQFVDGWSGKGVIQSTLTDSVQTFNKLYGTSLDSELACLYDPAHMTNLCASHEDKLLPSAIYNSTVSGLMSRTLLREDLIGPNDYHGAKVYQELSEYDVSNWFINTVTKHFTPVSVLAVRNTECIPLENSGRKETEQILLTHGYQNINNVKPSVGEATRVLIRRDPEKVMVKVMEDPDVAFILKLAKEKGVPVIENSSLVHYKAVGFIKELPHT